ncbi:MAG: outer membrane beta-barrel protein [Bacteroidales bacterium]|nr:outer membrane beta-barrel protein [Bacteroidales bacterium]
MRKFIFTFAFLLPLLVQAQQEVKTDSVTTTLDEVVVTPEMVNRFSDHKDYILTRSEKQQFPTAIQAIQTLPKIMVSDLTVSSSDGKGVKILINGVPSSSVDLVSIPSENISKIKYYSQPPIQYSNMGLGAVINVITKKQTGGSMMLNTLNAVTTGFGNDVASLKYNWGRSTLGVMYNINYRNYNDRRLDEYISYLLDGNQYTKSRTGRRSPYAYEQHMAELSYSNIKMDDYVFNAKFSLGALNRRRSSVQDFIMNRLDTDIWGTAASHDKDKYLSPSLDLYLNKVFGRHELNLNAVGTYYNSSYNYDYAENGMDDGFNTKTYIETDKYSLIGEGWYGYAFNPKTKFLFGVRYAYNTGSQKNSYESTVTNEFYTYAGLNGMLGKKWNYSLSLGLNGNYFKDINGKNHEYYYFRPQLNVAYFIDRSSELTFNYEVNTLNPTISQLTFNPYYKDIDYLYAGNPNLKPQNTHAVSVSYFKGFRKFIINPEVSYTYGKSQIAPVFNTKDGVINETIGNLKWMQYYKASLFLQWMPFANNLLRLRLYSEVMHTRNSNMGHEWGHTGYTIAPSVYLNYKKWSAEIFYQTETEMLSGQMLTTRPSMAKVEVSYRPIQRMTVGIGIRYPFYDSWKQTQKTYGTEVLSTSTVERIQNNANMIYVNFVFNLPFGKPSKFPKQKISNTDRDSGIFNRL